MAETEMKPDSAQTFCPLPGKAAKLIIWPAVFHVKHRHILHGDAFKAGAQRLDQRFLGRKAGGR